MDCSRPRNWQASAKAKARSFGSSGKVGRSHLGPPARCSFTVSFLVGKVPLLKWTTDKKTGTNSF